ncbi:MAG: hypothetical protein MZV64_09810 [Ignavibacteriales bacterium]|nr:hypothetical protein [Ignavibacteriales bacterium]
MALLVRQGEGEGRGHRVFLRVVQDGGGDIPGLRDAPEELQHGFPEERVRVVLGHDVPRGVAAEGVDVLGLVVGGELSEVLGHVGFGLRCRGGHAGRDDNREGSCGDRRRQRREGAETVSGILEGHAIFAPNKVWDRTRRSGIFRNWAGRDAGGGEARPPRGMDLHFI